MVATVAFPGRHLHPCVFVRLVGVQLIASHLPMQGVVVDITEGLQVLDRICAPVPVMCDVMQLQEFPRVIR